MSPWFSLILPCYNVERYVERCVQSILSQDFDNYEIILVDDGSTDRTVSICDYLAEQHPCIRVIHKENGGLSSARNTGLDAAQGKYIWFIDSDDWIEPGALNQLYQASQEGEPDLVKFAYYRVEKEKKSVLLNMETGIYQGTEKLGLLRRKAFCETGKYSLSACLHIYRRDFVAKYQLRFVSERLVGSEDYLFNLQALCHVGSLRVIPAALYVYEMRAGSLTQTYKADLMDRYSELYRRLKQYYCDADADLETEKLIDRFYVWHLAVGTALTQEYAMLAAHNPVRQVRRAARAVLSRKDVQNAAKNADQIGMRWQKKLQCFAIQARFEGLFYWLYAVKPGLKHDGKRRKRNETNQSTKKYLF